MAPVVGLTPFVERTANPFLFEYMPNGFVFYNRLPAKMPKQDKVLVVERIIDSLGLEQIRSSKVGTVQKRGISGGQRKRVNVGLEMVMEPSLLILDEPTSGLDSTSSFLVLRALRREAYVGVNVGVVLHQPR